MNRESLALEGLALVTPKAFSDNRGFFCERFRLNTWREWFPDHQGFCQDNFSFSRENVLRGLHFQGGKGQGKLVTCTSGSIKDVAVDIRLDSPTLGRSLMVNLDAKRPQWLWIPAGFAHGFVVTSSEGAGVLYKVDQPYDPASESAIFWNDPELAIQWPCREPICSAKDQAAKGWKAYLQAGH